MARHRPLLESLEGRYSPAVAADVSGAAESVRGVALVDAGAARGSFNFAVPALPQETFTEGILDGGRVLFAPPALPDPLMSQIGRLPQPSLAFPASGGGGHVSEELVAQLAPLAPSPMGGQADTSAVDGAFTPDGEAMEQG